MVMSVNKMLRKTGYSISRAADHYPPDYSDDDVELIRAVRPFTMTTPERLAGLAHATRYVVDSRIQGAIVECGVWKGGSMMAAALTLRSSGDMARELYLFDTFDGMPAPTDVDVAITGQSAVAALASGDEAVCARAGLPEVRRNLLSTGYDPDRMHFVSGMVETTIPDAAPEQISLLRLDTDWYESTLHELTHLYPRLVRGGVLIIDDYGHWQGARQAVDEYIAQNDLHILLNRLDYTGRIAVKC